MITTGSVCTRPPKLAQRAIGGHARAGERYLLGQCRRTRRGSAGAAPRHGRCSRPDGARRGNRVCRAALRRAGTPAGAAADPRIGQAPVADRNIAGVRAERHHLADRLVAHGERQGHAAVGELELLAAAEIATASQKCRSLWQTPAATTRSRTSVPTGWGFAARAAPAARRSGRQQSSSSRHPHDMVMAGLVPAISIGRAVLS